MRILALISLMVAAGPTCAQEVSTDAFGILPTPANTGERSNWSDVVPKGQVASSILSFVGPKSLIAGKDTGHAVAILFDAHGNLVSDGEQAEFVVGPVTHSIPTLNGIADLRFQPDPIAGEFEVGVSSGLSQSARATYRVTADLESLTPSVVDQATALKIETFAKFETEVLTDKFENTAPSGMGGQVVLTHPDGSFSLTTPYVQNGRLSTDLLVRDIPEGGVIHASVAGQHSTRASVDVVSLRSAGPTAIKLRAIPSIRAVEISAGPVLTDAGHVLNDGAKVTLTVLGDSGREITQTGWLRDGHFDAVLAIEPNDLPLVVTFSTTLGVERTRFETLTKAAATQIESAE